MKKLERNNFKLIKPEFNEISNDDLYVGSIKAYFSTYNTVNFRPDRMMTGCFDEEIKRFRNGDKMPRFLAQHWYNDVIGVVTNIYDDTVGAIFEAKIINTQVGKDMYIALKTGAIDEFSFAFYVTEFEYDQEGVRNVLKVEGIEEISVVTWGMDNKTKPIEINNKELTIRDAELALKSCGFSVKQSKTILANGFKQMNCDDSNSQCDVEKELNAGFDNLIKILGGTKNGSNGNQKAV